MKQFLLSLDPADQTNWTSDGRPRVDVVQKRFGAGTTREDINAALPGWCQEVAAQRKVGDVPCISPELCTTAATIPSLSAEIDSLKQDIDAIQIKIDGLIRRRDSLIIDEQINTVPSNSLMDAAKHALAARLSRTVEERKAANIRRMIR